MDPFRRGSNMELSLNEEKPFYNLRKKYGASLAYPIRAYWYFYNIEEPEDAAEALSFFLFRGKV